jgi:hypothetical protein
VHTSTKSATYYEEKQANISASLAKKIPFNTGAWCQGRGLQHSSKACRGTYERRERTGHDQQGKQWMRNLHQYQAAATAVTQPRRGGFGSGWVVVVEEPQFSQELSGS